MIEPCFGIGHNLSLICQLTSEDIKHHFIIIIIAVTVAAEAKLRCRGTVCWQGVGRSHRPYLRIPRAAHAHTLGQTPTLVRNNNNHNNILTLFIPAGN